MKKFLKSKVLAMALVVFLTISFTQCGFILYPERKGRTGGRIDPAVLIMDCAWLVCFIVPGVIALAVDFATGCIYESGAAMNLKPGDEIDLKISGPAPMDATVEVTLEAADGSGIVTKLYEQSITRGEELEAPVDVTIPYVMAPGEYKLALKVNDRTSAWWKVDLAQ